MHRYLLDISFDGTAYHGWQRQPNGMSVEERVTQGLSTLLRHEVSIVGAGRTDAGVHARQMPAHFDTEETFDCKQLAYKLNRILPRDIVVNDVSEVSTDLHARFSATSRTYHYYVHTHKSPFLRHYSCLITYPLDFQRMNEAAAILLQTNDFATFCKAGSDVKTTICRVSRAEWVYEADADRWLFVITADRFLRNMVRAVVGTLIEVGRGRMSIDDFQKAVDSRQRTRAGESMPANALFLWQVEY